MEIMPGHKVKYIFPNPNTIEKREFVGTVDFIGETFITLRNESNTLLKVSRKNFYLLEKCTPKLENIFFESENYFG